MTAETALDDRPITRSLAMATRLAEGHRVGDVMDEFAATRADVMDAGFAYELRFVPSRDAFDTTDRTHHTVLRLIPPRFHPQPQRRSPLVRPVVVEETTVPDPTGDSREARSKHALEALRDRMTALGIEPKALRTWAHLRNIDCPRTGTIPGRVIDAYEEWIAAGRPAPAMPEPAGPPERPALESTTWDDLGSATVETIAEDAEALDLTDDEVDELLDEAEAEEAPAATRVVAIAVGSNPRLVAAIMAAATEVADFAQVSVEDGWIYLEQAAS